MIATASASLTFATLFLGLVLGVRPVEVMATGPVAELAFELDGREVVRLFERPYRQPVDFGDEYSPHELVARAFDAKGQEIALARQWINLPRPPAEVGILLETGKSGKVIAARLAWASRMGPHPTSIALSIDGRPLSVDASGRAPLPAYDASVPHVVSSEVEFPGGIRGHADRVLGGGAADEAGSNLTAIPVRGATETPPSVESLQGRFRKNGDALRVMAVEHGPAQVYMVRDPGEIKEAFRRFGPYNRGLAGVETRLEIEDRIQLVWPLATEVPDQNASNVIFDEAGTIHGVDANFLFALTHGGTAKNGDAPRRFADAVAVAGLAAAATGSRRALVLALGENDWDHSRRSGTSIRHYLERIGVPLYVWSLAPERTAALPAAAWGEFDDVSSVIKLHRAASRVQNELRRQSIVWIEGRHLPQDIVLADAGDDLAIAR
jgi:hypothetical protein